MDRFLGCGFCGDCRDVSTKARIGEAFIYDASYLHHPYWSSSNESRVANLKFTMAPLLQIKGLTIWATERAFRLPFTFFSSLLQLLTFFSYMPGSEVMR